MTALSSFSAACKTRPFQIRGEKPGFVLIALPARAGRGKPPTHKGGGFQPAPMVAADKHVLDNQTPTRRDGSQSKSHAERLYL